MISIERLRELYPHVLPLVLQAAALSTETSDLHERLGRLNALAAYNNAREAPLLERCEGES